MRTRTPRVSRPTGGSDDVAAPKGSREEPALEEAYERLVGEGRERLDRPLLPLLSTGLLGGVDVGVGVLMYLVVKTETDSSLLAAMAFTIGFAALLLANSELFTENFLVPVISVIAKVGTLAQLARLWVRHAAGQPGRGVRDGRDDRGGAAGGARDRGAGRLPLRPPRRLLALVLPRGARRRGDHVADAGCSTPPRTSGSAWWPRC